MHLMSSFSFIRPPNLISATANSSDNSLEIIFFFKNFFNVLSRVLSIILVAATTASVVLEKDVKDFSFTIVDALKII